ncbi:hypothetical protein AMTR_s00032p00231660 [Amborella trichopoda]|uniref:eIF-4F 25 kDa subunit n=1 Tax=Amborella trichopoda TaxID=13333 RepID=U5CXZ1_AMBTC|nr:hypothetical protein AMTR_s00032p00231660 [Amborella trichopoda]
MAEVEVQHQQQDVSVDSAEEGEIIESGPPSSVSRSLESSHPLEHSWTFWFDNPSSRPKQGTWGSHIRPVHSFSTVEDFWCLYNNIHHPSKLAVGADLHCFKDKIEPKWEDPICANGGKWTITTAKGKADTWWLYTLLAMIGEQFDYGDEICGAVVSVRRGKQERIAIWTKNASNEEAQPCYQLLKRLEITFWYIWWYKFSDMSNHL